MSAPINDEAWDSYDHQECLGIQFFHLNHSTLLNSTALINHIVQEYLGPLKSLTTTPAISQAQLTMTHARMYTMALILQCAKMTELSHLPSLTRQGEKTEQKRAVSLLPVAWRQVKTENRRAIFL